MVIINKDDLLMRELEQTIWRRNESLLNIQEPSLDNPIRYVLMACVIKEMKVIWHKKGKLDFIIPLWTKKCPKLCEPYFVLSNNDMLFWENEECNKTFIAHNIFAPENYISFY